MKSKKLKPGH